MKFSNKEVIILNPIAIVLITLFPVFMLGFAIVYEGDGWVLLLFSPILLFSGAVSIFKNSVIDFLFILIISYIVCIQIITLQVWPEFIAFQDGNFSHMSPVVETIDKSFWIILCFVSGWALLQIIDSVRLDLDNCDLSTKQNIINIFFIWFVISIIALALLAFFYNYGIAGIKSDLQYEGIIYYIFPSDYLAIIIGFSVGIGSILSRKRKNFAIVLLVVYVSLEMACGWKSPVLNIFLAYTIGMFYGQRLGLGIRVLLIGCFIILLYVFLIKPVVNYVRVGQWFPEKDHQVSSNLNPLSSRLTEGTLYGVATIESGGNEGRIDMLHFLGDFINRLVPGTVIEFDSVDRVFTEDILGQPSGITSTFAPGIVGMGELLGGGASSFLYGAIFRAIIILLIAWAIKTKQLVTKLFILSSIPIFIVSVCIDGYFGGLEKIVIVAIIFTIISMCYTSVFKKSIILPDH